MSAVWLKLIAVLFLSCTAQSGPALSGPGSSGVVWKNSGESITIQCRFPRTDKAEKEFLHLKMGLGEDFVLVKEKSSGKISIGKQFTGRIQLNGILPNMDFLIKNLTSDDIGPYWCEHKWYNAKAIKQEITKGTGSVLLVVTDIAGTAGTASTADTAQHCESSDKNLVLVSVLISAAVLIGIIITGFLILIILKTKSLQTTVKPRRATTNDVYEDMRGTLRR